MLKKFISWLKNLFHHECECKCEPVNEIAENEINNLFDPQDPQ